MLFFLCNNKLRLFNVNVTVRGHVFVFHNIKCSAFNYSTAHIHCSHVTIKMYKNVCFVLKLII